MDKWKYYLLAIVMVVGVVYAIPNVYGEDPAVQITGLKGEPVNEATLQQVSTLLTNAAIKPKSIAIEHDGALLVRFADSGTQLRAKDSIRKGLNEQFSVALNLAPVTPKWLESIGAKPMKLGLDLRGGVHFLMEVDLNAVMSRRMEGYFAEMPKVMREAKLHYAHLSRVGAEKI